MCFLPQFHQIVEVRVGHIEHVSYMISLCITGLDSVPPFSKAHTSIFAQFEDDNNPLVSAMNVRRIVILRVHTECDSIESVRAHAARILSIGVNRASPLDRSERLLEVSDQVVFVLDAARQPDQTLGDADGLTLILGKRKVCGGGGVGGEGLDAAKRLSAEEELDRAEETTSSFAGPG
jgi:hypothetical protein